MMKMKSIFFMKWLRKSKVATVKSSHKRIVILGLDTFRKKNISQIQLMNERGYVFDVFNNDLLGDSSKEFAGLFQKNSLIKLESHFFARMKQLFLYFMQHRGHIHHAEIYSGGRFALFYGVFCSLFGIKSLVVERGDLKSIIEDFPLLESLWRRVVYKTADMVWYKEPYMENFLSRLKIRQFKMIPNAAEVQITTGVKEKSIDFLWVNRIVCRRDFDWVVKCFHNKEGLKTVALGYSEKAAQIELSQEVNALLNDLKGKTHFEVHGYIPPEPFYERAKFFVLPATFVFGNYSLLEAMSYGVVPIVSETEATSLIVQNNINGLTFNHDFESFASAIETAINMDEKAYQLLSDNAKKSIEEKFSLTQWANSVDALYSELHSV